jgi:5-methylcytosine-specific restriction endonuclease McrA
VAIDERGSSTERGYGSRWRKARATYLTKHPLCTMCEAQGRVTAATVVDHIIPHKKDWTLFWDSANWQPLCKQHHDSTKQRLEKSGTVVGCDINGLPVDRNHHWYK